MNHITCTDLQRKASSRHDSTCQTKSSFHTGSVHTASYSSMKTWHTSSSLKVKRLKTRKERNQIRDQDPSQHSKKVGSEKAEHHRGRHSRSVVSSRKEKTFARPFCPKKPSIITEGRLTSIRGLFSHEVRSVDIERVVSEKLKKEKQRKDPRKRSVMHTSPVPSQPPSMPDSDGECILDEIQEPEQPMRGSRKEPASKYTHVPQSTKEVTLPKEATRPDEKHGRRDKTGNEDIHNKPWQDSPISLKGTCKVVDSSLPGNKLTHRFCSTPNEADKNNFHFTGLYSPITHNKNKINISEERNEVRKIQRLKSTSAIDGFPNMDVSQSTTDPLSELDIGTSTLTDKERKQISVSVKKALNKLSARLENHMPRRPLLEECRDVLRQALHKTHSLHLQHNLNKLQSFIDGKQTTGFDAGQMLEECSHMHFSDALGNEESGHSRNTDLWPENTIQHEYISAEEFAEDPDRGASMMKRRQCSMRTLSPPVSVMQPLLSHTDTFDQSRTARLSQDCFRAQQYPSTTLFQQDEAFSQLDNLLPSIPIWTNQCYEPQQLLEDLQRKDESSKNLGLDISSHQWREKSDPMFDLYPENQSRKQKEQETSSFWSSQLQSVRERWAPALPFSTSFPLEGFRYKPFFRYSCPSNSQGRSDWEGFARSNTPDKVFYHYFG